MLPKLDNKKDSSEKPSPKIEPGTDLQKLGSVAKIEPKVKPVTSKKAIEKTIKKTKQSLSGISDFPAFFDFMRKENSEYHQQMEDMERDLSKKRDERHKEVMNILISATYKKTKAEKEIKRKVKKDKEETKKEEKKPTEAPKTEAPTKPETKPATQPATEAAKPTTQPAPATQAPAPAAKPVTAKPVSTPKPTVEPVPTTPPTPVVKPAIPVSAGTAGKAAVAIAGAVAGGSALAKIKGHESFVPKAYPDPEKNPDGSTKKMYYSVGYGHQITDKEVKQGFIQIGDTKVPVVGDMGKDTILTKEQGEALVAQDFAKYENAARAIPNFDKLNQPAQDALIDITYNMGVGWTKKFPSFMKSMANMELERASNELLYADLTTKKKTGYYTQVGSRAEKNADAIKKGAIQQTPQVQPTNLENKINDMSVENAEMKKLMRQGAGNQQVIIQQNFHNTVNRQHFVPPAQKQELNPTMQ